MTAKWSAVEAVRLTVEARYIASQRADVNLMRGSLHAMADQLEAALVRTAELEQLVGNLEHILGTDRDCATLRARVRSAHAQRDDAREECERLRKLVDELRCGDLDAFHDGELSPDRADAFALHLATCAACQSGQHDLMQVDVAVATAAGVVPR